VSTNVKITTTTTIQTRKTSAILDGKDYVRTTPNEHHILHLIS